MIYFNSIRVKFEPRDMWVGCYWKTESVPDVQVHDSVVMWKSLTLYVCILPMFPIIMRLSWRATLKVILERR